MKKFNFDHLIGKKVQVRDLEGQLWVGILKYADINELHGTFQVTLNRTPIWPVDPKSIKLYKEK